MKRPNPEEEIIYKWDDTVRDYVPLNQPKTKPGDKFKARLFELLWWAPNLLLVLVLIFIFWFLFI